MRKSETNKNNKYSTLRWILNICAITFILSLFFSYISTESITNIPLLPAFLILLSVIAFGVFADIIAIAITVANEEHFHAKASKKIKGAKTAIKLIRNSHKVANFCSDVIGDISGVLSGAISALIAIKISQSYHFGFDMQFLISAIVASLTVGGKALGRVIAIDNDTKIIHFLSKALIIFKKKR